MKQVGQYLNAEINEIYNCIPRQKEPDEYIEISRLIRTNNIQNEILLKYEQFENIEIEMSTYSNQLQIISNFLLIILKTLSCQRISEINNRDNNTITFDVIQYIKSKKNQQFSRLILDQVRCQLGNSQKHSSQIVLIKVRKFINSLVKQPFKFIIKMTCINILRQSVLKQIKFRKIYQFRDVNIQTQIISQFNLQIQTLNIIIIVLLCIQYVINASFLYHIIQYLFKLSKFHGNFNILNLNKPFQFQLYIMKIIVNLLYHSKISKINSIQ
ncbi:unnamed protein product (macronuclear) [Paramecium tetraurelia]|uniref:Transmembrane protein n=1 Tax=Paramecium tetraurelia TaxID=5888 RepID=A0CXR7_PARTE|nr:uncharacterized protein GSPATT00011216001 [Paramecium tetraurelia]CAK75584.1 unnamed protein product [Paramecium tetraurelia]|eukprot:XP_001442981.1 hypothetical protein (macronuclear) [Paramecium tetraurelia strain d4-2]